MAGSDIPLTTFRFEVVLDLDQPSAGLTSPLCDAAFAEAEGLDMTMQHKTVESGGVNDRQIQLIGPVTYGNLTLRRGMTRDLQLWTWFTNGTRPGSVLTAHGEVTMWARDGTPAVRFTLTGCLPIKMRAPALNAKDGLVAVEELTLVYQKLAVADPAAGSQAISASFGATASLTASASASFSAGASVSADASFGGGL